MSIPAQPSFASDSCTKASRMLALGLISLVLILAISFSIETSAFGASRATAKENNSLSKSKAAVKQAKAAADEAATQYAKAYGDLEKVGDRLSEVQSQLDSSEASLSDIQEKASNYAKDAYIRTSTGKDSPEEVVEDIRRTQLMSTVVSFDSNQLTHLVGLKEDLAIARKDLTALQEDRKSRVNELDKKKKELDTKLRSAQKAQKDLEAKLAKEAKARQSAARTPSRNASAGGSSNSGGAGQIINPGSGSIACPIAGSIAFTNDWGRPRSGGRTHKGNDLFSPRGTPNVAVVDGRVMYQREGTGGLSAYVTGGGNTYYYTHLNSFAGSNRTVKRGEVIGYTGSTGNAAGGSPHTHFEIRVGGANGNRVNPYHTLRSVC